MSFSLPVIPRVSYVVSLARERAVEVSRNGKNMSSGKTAQGGFQTFPPSLSICLAHGITLKTELVAGQEVQVARGQTQLDVNQSAWQTFSPT